MRALATFLIVLASCAAHTPATSTSAPTHSRSSSEPVTTSLGVAPISMYASPPFSIGTFGETDDFIVGGNVSRDDFDSAGPRTGELGVAFVARVSPAGKVRWLRRFAACRPVATVVGAKEGAYVWLIGLLSEDDARETPDYRKACSADVPFRSVVLRLDDDGKTMFRREIPERLHDARLTPLGDEAAGGGIIVAGRRDNSTTIFEVDPRGTLRRRYAIDRGGVTAITRLGSMLVTAGWSTNARREISAHEAEKRHVPNDRCFVSAFDEPSGRQLFRHDFAHGYACDVDRLAVSSGVAVAIVSGTENAVTDTWSYLLEAVDLPSGKPRFSRRVEAADVTAGQVSGAHSIAISEGAAMFSENARGSGDETGPRRARLATFDWRTGATRFASDLSSPAAFGFFPSDAVVHDARRACILASARAQRFSWSGIDQEDASTKNHLAIGCLPTSR